MITRLEVQNLAIIDRLEISFTPGFNVLTGETGAGKSILIRGLGLLMGAKSTAEVVRHGADSALISAEFVVPQTHPALAQLDALGIGVDTLDSGGIILLRRQFSCKGRSQAWINDVPVTLPALREVGKTLIDIFGQHENQRLFDVTEHADYVDRFLPERKWYELVHALSAECDGLVGQIQEGLKAFLDRDKSRDYLLFRQAAWERFQPSAEDYARVEALCRAASGSARARERLAALVELLDGESAGLVAQSQELAKRLGQLEEILAEKAKELEESARQAAGLLGDISYEVSRLFGQFDFDEAELEAAQARLFGYQDLFRKHGVRDIDALLEEKNRIERELSALETLTEKVARTLDTLERKIEALQEAAERLSQGRRKAADTIKQRVEKELGELAMRGARLGVEFHRTPKAVESLDLTPLSSQLHSRWREIQTRALPSKNGAERAEFLLAANPGEPLLPLAKIASGGEVSRILLALKKAILADAETCVLVFDEIDTGVSGRVADVVGKKLRELSQSFQVVCISHLPQVAAYADTHFLVQKVGGRQRTQTRIVRLDKEHSTQEIARLLSGAEVSESSLVHARALKQRATENSIQLK